MKQNAKGKGGAEGKAMEGVHRPKQRLNTFCTHPGRLTRNMQLEMEGGEGGGMQREREMYKGGGRERSKAPNQRGIVSALTLETNQRRVAALI